MSKKILLVDDDGGLLESFSRHLQKKGFEVDTAKNGEEALKKLKTIAPDIIISDMRMPKIDGAMLMKKLPKKEGFFPGKIIFTAFDDNEAVELAKVGSNGIFRVEKDRWETDLAPALSRAMELSQLHLQAWEQGKKYAYQQEYLQIAKAKIKTATEMAETLRDWSNNSVNTVLLIAESQSKKGCKGCSELLKLTKMVSKMIPKMLDGSLRLKVNEARKFVEEKKLSQSN